MTNRETEDFAINHVLDLERAGGREAQDARKQQAPVDVISPPRLIEVKAVGGSARGLALPLEQRQVDALRANPDSFSLYVVENVSLALAGVAQPQVIVLDAAAVKAMVDQLSR
jgi:hypothetical protein